MCFQLPRQRAVKGSGCKRGRMCILKFGVCFALDIQSETTFPSSDLRLLEPTVRVCVCVLSCCMIVCTVHYFCAGSLGVLVTMTGNEPKKYICLANRPGSSNCQGGVSCV